MEGIVIDLGQRTGRATRPSGSHHMSTANSYAYPLQLTIGY